MHPLALENIRRFLGSRLPDGTHPDHGSLDADPGSGSPRNRASFGRSFALASGRRSLARCISFVVRGVVALALCVGSSEARAQPFLSGALERDPASELASASLSTTDRALLGDGRVYEVRGDQVACAPARAAAVGGPLPPSREAMFRSATLVVPRELGAWSSVRLLGRTGTTYLEASLDCVAGLGPTRPVTLPPDRNLDLSPPVSVVELDDGSILAVTHGGGSDVDEARYSSIVRLVPGASSWTGADVFSTRALRSLVDPARLADFDRLLFQHLRIDDFVVTSDGAVWMAVRQLDDTSVRGTWLVRWRPGPGWSGTDTEVIVAFGAGLRPAVDLSLVPRLGMVVMDRRSFVDPSHASPELVALSDLLPQLVPAYDGSLWSSDGLTSPSAFERRLARLDLVPTLADLDGDTLTFAEEEALGSSDLRLDSDADRTTDVLERHVFDTNPASADSRPPVDVERTPRFGISLRVHTSAFASEHARLTHESLWTSTPLLCAGGACIDGAGERRTLDTAHEIAAMTVDAEAWIGWSRAESVVRFFDGSTLDVRVGRVHALDGRLGATERGFVSPGGLAAYAPRLPDRAAPLETLLPPELLGVDDATNRALVSVDDGRGQLVLRISETGEAHVLFRPAWIGLPLVESITWLDRHELYVARVREGAGAPARYALLDRAMRVVGFTEPPMDGDGYVVGRFFGRGYTLSGPGPLPAVGDFYTWMLGELVEVTPGLSAGDALLWSRGAVGGGLLVYREDGTVFRLASVEALGAIADEAAGARIATPEIDVMQMDVRADVREACLVDTAGGLFRVAFEAGSPTSLVLAREANAAGCAYDDEGELHWLDASAGRVTVRTTSDDEVASAPLSDAPRGLFFARDREGGEVWVVDTIGATFEDASRSACLRAGRDVEITPFDAAGITVRHLGAGPDVVAWIDAVIDAYPVTTGTVRAALVDDFCAGQFAEVAHSLGRPGGSNLFHQAYERVIGRSVTGGSADITVNEAAFALRPDGRFLFASRNFRSRGGGVGASGMLMQQAGAWLPVGGPPIAAHDPFRRSEPGALTLAVAEVGVRAIAVVRGDVPPRWGEVGAFDRPSAPFVPPDAGVGDAAVTDDAGSTPEPTEPGGGCACRTGAGAWTAGLPTWVVWMLVVARSRRRVRA